MLIPEKILNQGNSEAPSGCKESMKFLDEASGKKFPKLRKGGTAL
jgi:hypothetical protein